MNHFCNATCVEEEGKKKKAARRNKKHGQNSAFNWSKLSTQNKKFCTLKFHKYIITLVSISNPVVSLLPSLPYITFIKSRIFQRCRNKPKQAPLLMDPGVSLCGYWCSTTIFIPRQIVIRVKHWQCNYWATNNCRLSNKHKVITNNAFFYLKKRKNMNAFNLYMF